MADSRASAPPSEAERDDHPVTEIVSLIVLGLGLLALFLGYGWFWMVFVIGFAVVVPIVELLFGDRDSDPTDEEPKASNPTTESTRRSESKQDALDTLRDRYARGDLSDEEFERKVERLLETETPESAREHVSRNDSERDFE